MPSPEQLGHEQLAAIVEQAAKPSLLGQSHRSCKFRVQTRDGRAYELYLSAIDLDGQSLVGPGWGKALPPVSLTEIEAVWHAKPRGIRVAAFCGGLTLGGSLLGLLAGTAVNALGGVDGILVGAIAGAVTAAMLTYFLQDWSPMYRWVLVYGPPAA